MVGEPLRRRRDLAGRTNATGRHHPRFCPDPRGLVKSSLAGPTGQHLSEQGNTAAIRQCRNRSENRWGMG